MTEPVLSVRNLQVEFVTRRSTLRAIDGVSFDIAKGEVLGVVGESGAGKSVTGLAVIGLIDPPGRIAGGEIYLSGMRIDNLPPEEMRRIRGKRIGMIFQDPLTSLNPLYRIGDQLVETIRTHLNLSESGARKRAIDLLAEVGIPAPEKRIDAYPHEFSGGMRQRVVIALAICAEPELIIADEPTTALDVSVQAQIISLIKRLGRDHGTAVMLVTHDMGVIAETSDRVAVMYSGRIAEIGPVQDVVQNPLHPYAKGLMGAIPTLAGDARRLVQIPGSMPRLSAIPPGCAVQPALRLRVRSLPDRTARTDPARRASGRLPSLRRRRQGDRGMSQAPFVDVRNLRRVFDVSKPWLNRVLEGGHLEFLKAVDGVTFDIAKGETFALVGESGSGKTTVARMVVGLLPPTSGEVVIDGVSMTDAAAVAGAQAAAPPHPDDLPGPLCEPQSALPGRCHRRRADPRLRPDPGRARHSRPRRRTADAWSACMPTTAGNIRMNSPAASGSASRSRARSPPKPSSSSATSRPRRSTSPCRRRSST